MNKKTDFSQVMKNRNVTTDKTETTEYFMKTQRTQYDLYEYKETMNKDIKDTLDQILILEKGVTSPIDNESSYNESYDYERFKMEYEHQLEYDIKEGKVLNYTETEESNNTPKKVLKRIMNLKQPENCTKEELSQIGIKAIECLLYDYQRMKDITTAKVVLSRTWLVLRIWIFIYICLAILCWCQRGWCCCCFRCKFCFPRKRIILVKQYYTMNPPGVFMKDFKKKKDVKKEEPIRYGATKYEYDAYKTLETAIRNI
ncbi:uncharacterized protein LOC105198483 [Solenopsis invicta]|uniref:uncharacterized protein LOC105198483 n=1 Tax=Solenopsis invicta TaxID=13686 RepID=UPI000595E5E5|nr:uncharacterized protein LOC105198483 [Solenopsis invicta]